MLLHAYVALFSPTIVCSDDSLFPHESSMIDDANFADDYNSRPGDRGLWYNYYGYYGSNVFCPSGYYKSYRNCYSCPSVKLQHHIAHIVTFRDYGSYII
jgi:hypothetical protein